MEKKRRRKKKEGQNRENKETRKSQTTVTLTPLSQHIGSTPIFKKHPSINIFSTQSIRLLAKWIRILEDASI